MFETKDDNNKFDENKVNIIMKQTNMTEEEANKKLEEFDNNHIEVIRDWLGIKKKEERKKTINQEIFNQFRKNLYIEPEIVKKYQK